MGVGDLGWALGFRNDALLRLTHPTLDFGGDYNVNLANSSETAVRSVLGGVARAFFDSCWRTWLRVSCGFCCNTFRIPVKSRTSSPGVSRASAPRRDRMAFNISCNSGGVIAFFVP